MTARTDTLGKGPGASQDMNRASGSDADAFKACFGRFATGVLIATCQPPGEEAIGVTINSLSSVSLDPALALFCLEERSECLGKFLSAGHFALNILASDQAAISNRFARDHGLRDGHDTERWASGAPVLKFALAVADCTLQDVFGGGDHRILLGQVREVGWRESGTPLLYYRGDYGRIGTAPV